MRYDVVVPKPEEQHFKNLKTRISVKTVETKDAVTGVVKLVTVDVKELIEAGKDTEGHSVYEVGGEPVWGRGCPAGCGRFWEFTADAVDMVEETDADGVARKWPRAKVGSHFKPLDPAAYSGVAKDGESTEGYLSFTPDPAAPSAVKMFTCDRCGAEIGLVLK